MVPNWEYNTRQEYEIAEETRQLNTINTITYLTFLDSLCWWVIQTGRVAQPS